MDWKRLIKYWPFVTFIGILFLFAWKVFLKGYVIGPFDFLAGFYGPYREIIWPTAQLQDAARHYKNFLMTDVLVVVLPFKLTGLQMIREGILPLWNPYLLSGSPLLANVQSALLYPLNVIYFMFNPAIAYNIFILSQPILAFAFMYCYLRNLDLKSYAAFLGGLSFSMGAFLIVWLGWGTIGHTILWLPLALFSIDQYLKNPRPRYLAFLILSLVFSFFAGHTQVSLMMWGTTILYGMFKAGSSSFSQKLALFASFVVAILLVAVQLIPAVEAYRMSARVIMSAESFYKDQTLYFSSYLQAVFPDFFGNPVTRNWWGKVNYAESAIYFGSIAFTLALYAIFKSFKDEKLRRQTIFFVCLAIISILLSTQNMISHLLFVLRLPVVSVSTFSRNSALFYFAGSVLGAIGFNALFEDIKNKNKSVTFFATSMLLFVGVIWLATFLKLMPDLYIENMSILRRNLILPSLILGGLNGLLLFFANSEKIKLPFLKQIRNYPQIIVVAIVLLSSLEMYRFAHKYLPFSPREFFYPNHKSIEKLKELAGHDRYKNLLPVNINSMYKISAAEAGEPLHERRYSELVSMSKTGEINLGNRQGLAIEEGTYENRIYDLVSVKYIADANDSFRNNWVDRHGHDHEIYNERFRPVWIDQPFVIYRNVHAIPHEHMFYDFEVITDEKKVLRRLLDDDFPLIKKVIVPQKILDGSKTPGEFTTKLTDFSPLKQTYKVKTSQPGLFVVTDVFYPGWVATVDGKAQEIQRVNYTFRGLVLTKGDHTVTYSYQPKSFGQGVIVSGLGLIAFAALIIFSKKKN